MLAPCSQTSSLQSCEKTDFSCLRPLVYGTLLWQPRKTHRCLFPSSAPAVEELAFSLIETLEVIRVKSQAFQPPSALSFFLFFILSQAQQQPFIFFLFNILLCSFLSPFCPDAKVSSVWPPAVVLPDPDVPLPSRAAWPVCFSKSHLCLLRL